MTQNRVQWFGNVDVRPFQCALAVDDVHHHGVDFFASASDTKTRLCCCMTLCHRVHLVENLHLLIRNRVVSNCLNREPLVKYVRLCLSGDFRTIVSCLPALRCFVQKKQFAESSTHAKLIASNKQRLLWQLQLTRMDSLEFLSKNVRVSVRCSSRGPQEAHWARWCHVTIAWVWCFDLH